MELAQIIKILWDRKGLLLLIALVALAAGFMTMFHVSPSGVSKRSYVYGSAQTQILIDSPRSSLLDLNQETGPLATRAAVYAAFMRSNAITDAIAKEMGVQPGQVVAQGPFTTAGGTQNIPRPAEARANEVRGEADTYRLVFDAQQDLPIVTVYSQAPTGELAIKLANATVKATRDYVDNQETSVNVPAAAKTSIRELGPATGGDVQAGEKPLLAFMAVLAVFILGCVLVVAFTGLRRSYSKLGRELRDPDPEPEDDVVAPPAAPARKSRSGSRGKTAPEPDDADDLFLPPDPEREDERPAARAFRAFSR
jgi:capsular polysaccharide biosynthesis protein